MVEALIVVGSTIGIFAWTYQQLLHFDQRISTLEVKLDTLQEALTTHANESKSARAEIIKLINSLLLNHS